MDSVGLSSIALYKQLNANYLLIDEKTARRVAKLNNIIISTLRIHNSIPCPSNSYIDRNNCACDPIRASVTNSIFSW
jgi:predicted nucleic acid-binding protein